MSTLQEDRRKYKRFFFDNTDNAVGMLILIDEQKKSMSANIINISEGGAGLTVKKNQGDMIKKGDHLMLKEIKGSEQIDFLLNIEMEVKWLIHHSELRHIGLGCEFVNPSMDLKENIRKFIEYAQ